MPNGFEYRGKRLVRRSQEFSTSGVFYPSRGLIEAGGLVDVYVIGGGASGIISGSGGSGGNAGQAKEGRVQVSAPSTVVIGAGGAAVTGTTGNNGGETSFGPVSAAGGTTTASYVNSGGAGAGGSAPVLGGVSSANVRAPSGFCRSNHSAATCSLGGPPNARGHGHGGSATAKETWTEPGSGGGGGTSGTSGAGANGFCELTWWEYEQ